jgi:glycosyltransferase involved in cell wall biosynthesis
MSAYESQVMRTEVPPEEKRRVLSRGTGKSILFVSNSTEYGGAEKHLLELIRRMRVPGVQLRILCLDKDFFTERLAPDQDVEVIACKKAPRSVSDWVSLFRTVQTDVAVFIYGVFWAIPSGALAGAWLAGVPRRFSIQHLMTERITVPPQVLAVMKKRRSLRGKLGKLLGRREPQWMADVPLSIMASTSTPAELRRSAYLSKTTICVSNALRDSLVNDFGFPARKLKTIHNGVSLSEFVPGESGGSEVRQKLGLDRDEFVLVCVARLSAQKGIDILLQAMARVVREGVHCKCIIVGDGPLEEQLCEQALELGLSGHVFFEGFHEDVRPYLRAGSAFILTSHREGLPLSILEAMACGLPCVVTNVGGNAEAVTNQVHGLVVPPGSVDAVADAISYLVTHSRERAQMARMARARVCETFDIENAMAEIRRVILD